MGGFLLVKRFVNLYLIIRILFLEVFYVFGSRVTNASLGASISIGQKNKQAGYG